MDIKKLLKIATNKNASDLHIVSNKPPILRIDGELKVLPDFENIKPYLHNN